MYRIFALLIIPVLCNPAIASNQSYEQIWKEYAKERKMFLSCKSTKQVSNFLLKGMDLKGSAELEQAYNGTIGEAITEKPICVLNALIVLPSETQKNVVNKYLVRPLFKDVGEIEKSLNKVWNDEKFSEIRVEFLRLKKLIYEK